MGYYSVAIDGPSGAGKSTLARLAAKKLGYVYVDTGAIYRTVGLYTLRSAVSPADEAHIEALLPDIRIDIRYDGEGLQRMLLNGEDVTDLIRTPEVSKRASDVSALPCVRAFLLGMQREMALRHSVIMDGRDIGTVVLPDASVKLFVTASPEVRSQRRYEELCEKGVECTPEQVLRDIEERDKNDSSRAIAPLRPASDAIVYNSGGRTPEQSAADIIGIIEEKLREM